MGDFSIVDGNTMGFRMCRLCRMRLNPTFVVIIGIATILMLANYIRSRGNDNKRHSMIRDSLSMSRIRELQATNQGRNRKRIRFDDEDEQPFQICRTPHLSLQNDANADFFFKLPELNCSKADSLFHTRMGSLYLNKTVLGVRNLDRCEYKAVIWETDNYYSYSETLVRKEPPFEMKVKHDFFKIECYLKSDSSNKEAKNPGEAALGMMRRLLQIKEKNVSNRYTYDMSAREVQARNYMSEPKVPQTVQNTIRNTQFVHRSNRQTFQSMPANSVGKNPPGNGLKTLVKHKLNNNNMSQNIARSHGIKDTAQNMGYMKRPIQPNTFQQHAAVALNSQTAKDQIGNQMQQHNLPPTNVQQANPQGLYSSDMKGGVVHPGVHKKSTQVVTIRPSVHVGETRVESNNRGNIENRENGENQGVKEENQDKSDYEYKEEIPSDYQYVEPEIPDFEQYFVQVIRREDVIKRIKDIKPNKHSTQMNVLMFALDSMSHMAYQRKMPKTYNYIKEKLGAVTLDSYNIVGDATTAAIIPMLTGKTETELPEVRKEVQNSRHVDVYPMIWKEFKKNGYATLYNEDEPRYNVFHHRFNGFEEIPTDHYMRHFWLASHASNLYDISPRFCLGRTARHQFLLQYMRKFHITYRDVPTFSFNMITEYTHGNNNPGQYVDEDLVETLEILRRNKILDNTLVIIFGDHGSRTSKSRKSVQGKMEERLPMMSLAFPQWFKEKYPKLMKNLKTNANRLTTPFDIYETLRDVLDIHRPETPITFKERGISLLKEMPLNRTCASAGIDMHWCTCMHWRPVDGFEAESKLAARHIVDFMNSITYQHRHMCHKLELKRIEDAKMVFPNEKVLTFMKSIDSDQRIANFSRDVDIDFIHYQIIVETSPNNGLYEATVAFEVATKTYKVSPDISRINIYGKQASCVEEKLPDLRKYCHCKQKIDKV